MLTGGSLNPERAPTAQGYAQAARDMGVPADRILALDSPLDTAQEANAVREALAAGLMTLAPSPGVEPSVAPAVAAATGVQPKAPPVGSGLMAATSAANTALPVRIVLVTTAAHMPRAMRHFQAVGLEPIPAPAQYLTGRERHASL